VTDAGAWHVFTEDGEQASTAFAVTLPNLATQVGI
jgi:hypothetical protein